MMGFKVDLDKLKNVRCTVDIFKKYAHSFYFKSQNNIFLGKKIRKII